MTHAGARAIWDIPRLKSDDALRAIAASGGVIGMSAAPHTTISYEHPKHSILSVMDHFMYCLELVGIDHVGFGPDTLYGDHVGLHTTFASLLSAAGATTASHERVEYVDGLENPTESFHNIAAWLVHNGFSDEDIVKVLGGNILRVLGEAWV
jgi:membrane dipeptidase